MTSMDLKQSGLHKLSEIHNMDLRNKHLLLKQQLSQSGLFTTRNPGISLKSPINLTPFSSQTENNLETGRRKFENLSLQRRSELISTIQKQKQTPGLTSSVLSSSLLKNSLITSSGGQSSSKLTSSSLLSSSSWTTSSLLTTSKSTLISKVSKKPLLSSSGQPDIKRPKLEFGSSDADKKNASNDNIQEEGNQDENHQKYPDYSGIFQDLPFDNLNKSYGFDKTVQEADEYIKTLREKKENLIKAVSVSLIGNPNLSNPDDPVRQNLIELAKDVSQHDGEFILKLSVYSRHQLNLRTTTNLLLAFAALEPNCKPHLFRYYAAAVHLPSDWTAVADLVQTFGKNPVVNASLLPGSLPACLRRPMVDKFKDFDEYQLAKYNKASSSAKKKSMGTRQVKPAEVSDWAAEVEAAMEEPEDAILDEDEFQRRQEELRRRKFTIKRLIRLLHISQPVEHVLAILGKKYPTDEESFRVLRLPGFFNPDMAGKRMKLATPETWETQIARLGNRKEVWEQLIENRKLPYMATIRNLRNLLLAGIDDKYVEQVCNMISNENRVIKSRMFPFRFFTAFDALIETEQLTRRTVESVKKAKKSKSEEEGWREKKLAQMKRRAENVKSSAIKAFRDSLNKAIALATAHNIPPLKGKTVVCCAFGSDMKDKVSAQKGMNGTTVRETALLFALMTCKAAEQSNVFLYSRSQSRKLSAKDEHIEKLLEYSKIVENNHRDLFVGSRGGESCFKTAILEKSDVLTNNQWIDNLVILHGPKENLERLPEWLANYRYKVNPNLVMAAIDVSGHQKKENMCISRHPTRDLYLSGFSEQIFQCLIGIGNGGQLEQVENIDKKFKLVNTRTTMRLADPGLDHLLHTSFKDEWKSMRVFISSTFLDMHGERDMINRFVAPELQKRGRQLHVDVHIVDLRWGINTYEDNFAKGLLSLRDKHKGDEKHVLACLKEIDKCDLFIGILGERYGWKPQININNISDKESREKLLQCVEGKSEKLGKVSITELEMEYAALSKAKEASQLQKCFFFLRDSRILLEQIPESELKKFTSEDKNDQLRLASLKEKIRKSGFEVFDGYPSNFCDIVQEKPISGGLSTFGTRLVECLWNAVTKIANKSVSTEENEFSEIASFVNYIVKHNYVERPKITNALLNLIKSQDHGLLEICGKTGLGATYIMCKLYATLKDNKNMFVIPFFADAFSSPSQHSFLNYLGLRLKMIVGQGKNEARGRLDMKTLTSQVTTLLNLAVICIQEKHPQKKLVLLLDGIESLTQESKHFLKWLPPLPFSDGLLVILTSHSSGSLSKELQLRREQNHAVYKLNSLDYQERKAIVQHSLEKKGKKLAEGAFNNELNLIISKRDAGCAEYLSLMITEISSYGIFEQLGHYLSSAGGTTMELIQQILARLEKDPSVVDVEEVLTLLAASKHGLTENELLLALGWLKFLENNMTLVRQKDFSLSEIMQKHKSEAKQLQPQLLILSETLNTLSVFLKNSPRTSMINLKNNVIANILLDKYLKRDSCPEVIHMTIAIAYLETLANGSPSTCICDALPYHVAKSGDINQLKYVLCNIQNVQLCAQLRALSIYINHLQAMNIENRISKEKFLSSEEVHAFTAFVTRFQEELEEQPCLTLQYFTNFQKSFSFIGGGQGFQILHGKLPPFLLKRINSAGLMQPLVGKKNFRENAVTAMALEESKTIPSEKLLIVHGHLDGHISVFLAQSFEYLFSLIGHSTAVTSLSIVSNKNSDSAILVSGSEDGMISFWDLNMQIRLSTIQGHSRSITGIASSSDGLTVVSVGWDCLIKIWSAKSFSQISVIKQKNGPFNCVQYHPEKDCIVTGGWDGLIKIYDLTSLERRAVLRGHESSIQAVKLSSEAKRVYSADLDGIVKVFDSQFGEELASFDMGQSAISLALDTHSIDEDCRVLVGLRDGQVKVLPALTETSFQRLENVKLSQSYNNLEENDVHSDALLTITCIQIIRDLLIIGFSQGHIQILELDSRITKGTNKLLKHLSDFPITDIFYLREIEVNFCDQITIPTFFDEENDDVQEMAIDEQEMEEENDFESNGFYAAIVTKGPEVLIAEINENRVRGVGKLSSLSLDQSSITKLCVIQNGILLATDHGSVLYHDLSKQQFRKSNFFYISPTWIRNLPLNESWKDFTINEDNTFIASLSSIDVKVYSTQNILQDSFIHLTTLKLSLNDNWDSILFISFHSMNQGIVLASSQSDEINILKIKITEDNIDKERLETGNESENITKTFEIYPKALRFSKRGPITKIFSFSSKHFFCQHNSGGLSILSPKGVELRWIPAKPDSVFCPIKVKDSLAFLLSAENGHIDLVSPFCHEPKRQLFCHRNGVSNLCTLKTSKKDGCLAYTSGPDGMLKMWDLCLAETFQKHDHCLDSRIIAVHVLKERECLLALGLSENFGLSIWHISSENNRANFLQQMDLFQDHLDGHKLTFAQVTYDDKMGSVNIFVISNRLASAIFSISKNDQDTFYLMKVTRSTHKLNSYDFVLADITQTQSKLSYEVTALASMSKQVDLLQSFTFKISRNELKVMFSIKQIPQKAQIKAMRKTKGLVFHERSHYLDQSTKDVWLTCLAFNEDQKYGLGCTNKGTAIVVYNQTNEEEEDLLQQIMTIPKALHESSVNAIISIGSSMFGTCGQDGKIKLWSVQDDFDLCQIGEFSFDGSPMTSLTFDSDVKLFIAGDLFGRIHILKAIIN